MSGSRFLKLQSAFLTALILMTVTQTSLWMGAEPLKKNDLPAPSLAMAAFQEEDKRVVINIPSRTLWVYSGDKIVRYFPVGVGRPGYMTPVGKFSIIRKVIDPGWENPYLPNGKVRLAPGEDNPLGTRWMGFYQKDGGEYGLHGTDSPESVGRFSSHGCVRMKVKDAEALFEMVDVGTPVEVVYQPVLIRRQGDDIRVIVYADRFKKGMPSVEKVKTDIIKQYPDAKVNVEKLKMALQVPNERPVAVGAITSDMAKAAPVERSSLKTERRPVYAGKELLQPASAAAQPEKVPRIEPENASIRVETTPVNGSAPSTSKRSRSLQTPHPAVKDSELPLNPSTFFN